jgi:hypothetical protein
MTVRPIVYGFVALLAFMLAPSAHADDRSVFRGCVVERGEASILLATSADERIRIDTTWLKPESLAAALTDCVTVTAVTVDGQFVAESIEAGDEPNEVNSVTKETTQDRERRQNRRDNDDNNGKKKS